MPFLPRPWQPNFRAGRPFTIIKLLTNPPSYYHRPVLNIVCSLRLTGGYLSSHAYICWIEDFSLLSGVWGPSGGVVRALLRPTIDDDTSWYIHPYYTNLTASRAASDHQNIIYSSMVSMFEAGCICSPFNNRRQANYTENNTKMPLNNNIITLYHRSLFQMW